MSTGLRNLSRAGSPLATSAHRASIAPFFRLRHPIYGRMPMTSLAVRPCAAMAAPRPSTTSATGVNPYAPPPRWRSRACRPAIII